jgi:ferredoxin
MKKITIDKTKCIGCGACQAIAPDVYEVIDGLATVHENKITPENYEEAIDASTGCPVEAIIVSDKEEEKKAA